jgi:hypothetical protein
VREKRLQLAMRQATRENNYYLENVDKSRMIKDMEARKKAKRPAEVMWLQCRAANSMRGWDVALDGHTSLLRHFGMCRI